MRQKFISAAVILSMLVGLTACGGESDPTNSGSAEITGSSTPSGNNPEPSTSDLTSSASSDASILTEPASSDTSGTALQVENWEDFIGADGSPVTLSDAVIDDMGSVAFNYAFLRYVPPIYDDTFKNPELINWETMEFAPGGETYTPAGTRVKTGDVLENGLKVTQAEHTLEYETSVDEETQQPRGKWVSSSGYLMFEGELTLSGALYCVPEDDYMAFEGELHFFPDTNSFQQLPVVCDFDPKEKKPLEMVFPDAKFAVRCGTVYYLGNISDTDCGGVIEKGEAAAVTVTIKNIRLVTSNINHGGRGSAYYADIVSIENINS